MRPLQPSVERGEVRTSSGGITGKAHGKAHGAMIQSRANTLGLYKGLSVITIPIVSQKAHRHGDIDTNIHTQTCEHTSSPTQVLHSSLREIIWLEMKGEETLEDVSFSEEVESRPTSTVCV